MEDEENLYVHNTSFRKEKFSQLHAFSFLFVYDHMTWLDLKKKTTNFGCMRQKNEIFFTVFIQIENLRVGGSVFIVFHPHWNLGLSNRTSQWDEVNFHIRHFSACVNKDHRSSNGSNLIPFDYCIWNDFVKIIDSDREIYTGQKFYKILSLIM